MTMTTTTATTKSHQRRFFLPCSGFIWALLSLTSACGNEIVGTSSETQRTSGDSQADARSAADSLPLAEARDIFCPKGTSFLSSHRLCANDKEAIGPFPRSMMDKCEAAGGGTEACNGARWDAAFAKAVRGTTACPPGSALSDLYGECVAGADAFGPFPKGTVESCRKNGGGPACETMRISVSFLPKASGYVGSRPYLKLVRAGGNTYNGLAALRLELRDAKSRVVDTLTTVSGQNWAQSFRRASKSQSGSMEPAPEALWRIRYPNAGTNGIEWAGSAGNYGATFGPGFGPTFTEIVTQDGFATARTGIAFHLDANRATSPGTAGCIGFANMTDLRRFVGWFGQASTAPRTIVVDWGLSTLPGRFSLSDLANFGLDSDYVPVRERLKAYETE